MRGMLMFTDSTFTSALWEYPPKNNKPTTGGQVDFTTAQNSDTKPHLVTARGLTWRYIPAAGRYEYAVRIYDKWRVSERGQPPQFPK
jgi:hypothetical protein